MARLKVGLRENGTEELEQYFVFADTRIGILEITPIKITESGFFIFEELKTDPATLMRYIYVTKTPTTNNDVAPGHMPAAAQVTQKDYLIKVRP